MQSIGVYIFVGVFIVSVLIVIFVPCSWHVGIVLLCIVAVLFLAGRNHSKKYSIPALALSAAGLAIVRVALVPTHMPDEFLPLLKSKQILTGTVVALPDERETQTRLTIRITNDTATMDIIAAAPLYPRVHMGDIVSVSGTLTRPTPFQTDGGRVFAYDQFLRKDGVFALMQPANVEVTGASGNVWLRFMRVLEYVRDTFISLLQRALPEPESSLAVGIVIGGKQGLGARLLDSFTKSGMLQIVVLSGYNVMIVANGVMRALARAPKKYAAIAALACIACFILAAGAGSSALRAGIMAFFAVIAHTYSKRYDVLRALTLALFLLILWNPLMLAYDPGFQFSFLATVGLILGSPLIYERILWMQSHIVREILSTTLAAEIGILPLLLWQTGNLSLVSVFANASTMPVIPFAMAASTICALLVIPLGYVSNIVQLVSSIPAYLPLAYVVKVAEVSAALPFANVIVPMFSFWIVIAAYAGLVWLVVMGYRKRAPQRAPPASAPTTQLH